MEISLNLGLESSQLLSDSFGGLSIPKVQFCHHCGVVFERDMVFSCPICNGHVLTMVMSTERIFGYRPPPPRSY